ncbi:CU044_5270 family protein [Dactylosporangium sp. NPDC051541]|uniref:CU044_5270 family protein n=1 Tax=Dactylosporangium sp. NPDC051541 TaxID=3363977 RepID=UPI0037B9E65F
MNDTMRRLAEARPARLDPAAPPPELALTSRAVQRRRSPRRLILAAAVTAAAAIAITAATTIHEPSTRPTNPTNAEKSESATNNILLVAATKNETAQAKDGRYWVLRQTHIEEGARTIIEERWLATRPGDPSSGFFRDPDQTDTWTPRAMQGHTSENNFLVGGRPITLAELNALPTNPQALQAAVPHDRPEDVFFSGAALVLDLPAPAPVRAAAYRMLAALPGIETLGEVTDALGRKGVAVAYSRRGDSGAIGQQRLIVDPATGQALAQESWTDGKRLSCTAVMKAEFADGPIPATLTGS